MKIYLNLLFAISLIITSCSSPSIPKDVNYSIVKEEPNINDVLNIKDCALSVKLNKRVDENTLTAIANEIKKDRMQYKRLWIKYYLSDVESSAAAWATSDFEPELKIEIGGSSEVEVKKTINFAKNIDGDIIGKWYEEGFTQASYVLFRKNNKIIMRTYFQNGQTMDDEMNSNKVANGTKYSCSQSECNGEYYIVNDKLELEFYNKVNKRFTVGVEIK